MQFKERSVIVSIILINLMILFSIIISGNSFIDNSKANFDEGSYNQTFYNITDNFIQLNNSEGFTSGNYTSKVFDANKTASWNNISWENDIQTSFNSTLTSAIHLGSSVSQVLDKNETYYTADMKNSSKRFYLNFSNYLINNTILKIYAKKSKGVPVGIYAESDTSGNNPLGNFTVTSTTGEWHNITLNLNFSTKAIWLGEGINSGTDPKEKFDYIFAEGETGANLTIQARSDDDNSNWENWTGPDGSQSSYYTTATGEDLNISNNRYFQYKIEFSTKHPSITPILYNITIDYTPDNSQPTWIIEPKNQTITEGNSLSYSIEATDNIAIDTYSINNTLDFIINQSGTISNISTLPVTAYNLKISVNDTSNNILSKVILITVQLVDTTPPIISNISETITTSTSTISWATNELANSSINYGLIQNLTSNISSSSLVTSHSLEIINLSSSTLYYYNITSCDSSNNCITNGTFSFTTSTASSPSPGGSSGGGSGGGGKRTKTPETQEAITPLAPPISTLTSPITSGEEKDVIQAPIVEPIQEETTLQRLKNRLSTTPLSGNILTIIILILLATFGIYEGNKLSHKKSLKNLQKKSLKQIHKNLAKAGFKVKTKSSELLKILQGLNNIGHIEGSAAISRDGLIIASNIPRKTGAEKFSATSALIIKSSEEALKKLNKGKLDHIILNTETKKVIATTAGKKAILVSLVKKQANLGLMILEIKKAAKKIENKL